MTKYEIERGVPIPAMTRPKSYKRNPNSRMGAVRRLSVGDSFFEACAPDAAKSLQMCLSACARVIHARDGVKIKLVTRSVEGGVRVWRVE